VVLITLASWIRMQVVLVRRHMGFTLIRDSRPSCVTSLWSTRPPLSMHPRAAVIFGVILCSGFGCASTIQIGSLVRVPPCT
jgi:hypothetical protein